MGNGLSFVKMELALRNSEVAEVNFPSLSFHVLWICTGHTLSLLLFIKHINKNKFILSDHGVWMRAGMVLKPSGFESQLYH